MLSRLNAYNTHTHTHTRARAHTHNGTEKTFFEKRQVFKEDLKELTEGGCMTDRNKELAPDSCSPVRERALITGFCAEG